MSDTPKRYHIGPFWVERRTGWIAPLLAIIGLAFMLTGVFL